MSAYSESSAGPAPEFNFLYYCPTVIQNKGIKLDDHQKSWLVGLIRGPPNSAMATYAHRQPYMLDKGEEILKESLPRLIREVLAFFELPDENLARFTEILTADAQMKGYYQNFDLVATTGYNLDLADAGLDGVDVFKLVYAVCSGDNDTTQQIDNFFKKLFIVVIPALAGRLQGQPVEYAIRPPQQLENMIDNWDDQSSALSKGLRFMPKSEPLLTPLERLQEMCEDAGMALALSTTLKNNKKAKIWVCKIEISRAPSKADLTEQQGSPIFLETSRGYGNSPSEARQNAAQNLISMFPSMR